MMLLITVPLALLKWLATVGLALLLMTIGLATVGRKFMIPRLVEKPSSPLVRYLVLLSVSLLPMGLAMAGIEIFKDFLPIHKEGDLSVRFYARLEWAIFFYTTLGVSGFAAICLTVYFKRRLSLALR